jgi:hypothetical protein
MVEETAKQTDNRPWLYKKGQSGNPSGRPKGSVSLKTWVKNKIATMSDEEREEFLEGMDKKEVWKMAEGLPQQDITSGGEKINPIPIINVFPNNSDKQDTETEQEDKNNSRRNVSEQNGQHNNILNSVGPNGQSKNPDEHSIGELPTS